MHPLNSDFARLLAVSGWNKAEAARQLELSAAVITRYMNGETRPSLTVLKLFKLLIGDLKPLVGEYAETAAITADERPLDAAERQLIDRLRILNEENRRQVCQAVTKLLDAAIPAKESKHKSAKKSKPSKRQ